MQDVHFPKNERLLFLAVIEAAMQDAEESDPRVQRPAIEWLMQDQADFPHICELAGLDCASLRRNLARFSSSSHRASSILPASSPQKSLSLKVGVPDRI